MCAGVGPGLWNLDRVGGRPSHARYSFSWCRWGLTHSQMHLIASVVGFQHAGSAGHWVRRLGRNYRGTSPHFQDEACALQMMTMWDNLVRVRRLGMWQMKVNLSSWPLDTRHWSSNKMKWLFIAAISGQDCRPWLFEDLYKFNMIAWYAVR